MMRGAVVVVMWLGLVACSGSRRGDNWVYDERDNKELVTLILCEGFSGMVAVVTARLSSAQRIILLC